MKPTPLVLAVFVLGAATAHAQPTTPTVTSTPGFAIGISGRLGATGSGMAHVVATIAPPAPKAGSSALTRAMEARHLQVQFESGRSRGGAIDWIGLLTEQVKVDAVMHMYRLTELKTNRELFHRAYVKGYVSGVEGYFTTGPRWNDGDPFYRNNIYHPIMGGVSNHVYTNHDRRCTDLKYGDRQYWSCIRRATIFSVVASVNWEWNPLMSETAIGHVGKFHTCVNGKCAGEGGWSDFVMTPLGGAAFRIAGDIARAKLWPVLDRRLSGNTAAKIAKAALKVASDPCGMANRAFNLNFKNALSTSPHAGRR
jgi:hypothetical protein